MFFLPLRSGKSFSQMTTDRRRRSSRVSFFNCSLMDWRSRDLSEKYDTEFAIRPGLNHD